MSKIHLIDRPVFKPLRTALWVGAFALFTSLTCSANEYDAISDTLQTCAACHGPTGAEPISEDIPVLAGQHLYYTYLQLKDLK